MSSIVIDIQRDVLNSNKSTTDILRQAYVIARKLKIKDFEIWIYKELNGYKGNIDIPEYRIIFGTIKWWNPYRGWMPVIVEDEKMYDKLTKVVSRQSIPELEKLMDDINKSDHKGSIIERLPDSFNNYIDDQVAPTQYIRELNVAGIVGIIQKVKNIIMEWILKLEEDGIIGVDMNFSDKEKQIADSKNYTVNNFYGNVSGSQIQQNSNYSSQEIHSGFDDAKFIEILKILNDHKDEIVKSLDDSKNFEKELEKLNNEIKKDRPSNNILNQSLLTIRNIIEGISGNIIAAGILYKIQSIYTI